MSKKRDMGIYGDSKREQAAGAAYEAAIIKVHVTREQREVLLALVNDALENCGNWRTDYTLRHTPKVTELRKLKHELEQAGS